MKHSYFLCLGLVTLALITLFVNAATTNDVAAGTQNQAGNVKELSEEISTPAQEENQTKEDEVSDAESVSKRKRPGHVGHRYCYMTSKRGKNCNRSTCRHGGGRCDFNPSGRCYLYNGGAFECRYACTCRVGHI
ncbi:hypothetical protein O181_028150 [Austropuccinia psidii MF-1]|uniref:Uncharacterized protein n=1 Tax=Austropuccinia psidii MF-1 TaxID=1389203 RepID=A0A9Q3CSR0_9BASI|nr:hypothetical protein [Austropuccinia psidii MF-1]